MSSVFKNFFRSIVVLGFLPVALTLLIILYFQRLSKKELIEGYQKLTDTFAFASYESINNFAKRLDYLKYLKSIYPDDKKFLISVLAKYPEVVFACLVDERGLEKTRISKNEFGKAFAVVDISKERYFDDIKRNAEGVIGNFQIKRGYPLATIVYPVGKESVYTIVNLIDFFSNIYQTRIGESGFVFFVSDDGKILSDKSFSISSKDITSMISQDSGSFSSFIGDEEYIFVFRRVSVFDFYTVVAQSSKEMFRNLNILFYGVLFLLFLVLTVSYFISYISAKKLTEPISCVVDASYKVADGDFSVRVDVGSDIAEINKLIDVFNMMVEKLKEYEGMQIEKIMDEREKLNAIISTIESAVALTHLTGDAVYMNQRCVEIAGENPRDFFHSLITRGFKEKTNTFEKNNRYYQFVVRLVTLLRDYPLLLFVVEDITAEVTLYRAKEEVFRSIVHDVRNPLLNMQGYIKLLSYDADEKTKRYISALENESNIIFRMLENILDMARIENKTISINLSKVDMVEFIKSMSERFSARASYKNIDFITEIKTDKAYAEIDEELFQRAVDNILSNAFKYTHSGGRVVLCLEREGGMIKISVKDNGKGIEKERLKHLFEKFRSFSSDGFGLGLSIAKAIVEMHGGRIEVDSEKNKGSEVRIFINCV
ncbi:MAG: ATP-binding protein [Elusimicrobiales bacterium]